VCSPESGSGWAAGGGARVEVTPEYSQKTVGEAGPVPQTTAEPKPRSPVSHTGCVNPQFKGEACHFSAISGTKQNCNYKNRFKMLGRFHFHSLCFLMLVLFAIHGNPCSSGVCVGQVFWGCSLSVSRHAYGVFQCVCLSGVGCVFVLDRCLTPPC